MARLPTIRELNRLVRICSQDDVLVGGVMKLRREDVQSANARIEPINQGASWSESGRNVEDQPTHRVTLRAMPNLEVTRLAWLYEVRRASADRWYKVLRVSESEDLKWWTFYVIVDARTDNCPPAYDAAQRRPHGGLARPAKL